MSDEEAHQQLRLLALAAPASGTVLAAALAVYDDARADGLCHKGAWECALQVLDRASETAVLPPVTTGGKTAAQRLNSPGR